MTNQISAKPSRRMLDVVSCYNCDSRSSISISDLPTPYTTSFADLVASDEVTLADMSQTEATQTESIDGQDPANAQKKVKNRRPASKPIYMVIQPPEELFARIPA